MKKSGFRISLFVLTLLISFVWITENALAAKLLEIRTGKKSGFTRLVFQFETPPRFQVQGKSAPGQLTIIFLDTSPGSPLGKQTYADPVKAIEVNRDGSNLKAVVVHSMPHFRLKTFRLTEPHRVVFDLYPAAVAESQVKLNKLVVKESVEAASPLKKPPPLPKAEPEPPAEEPELPAATDTPPPALESKPESSASGPEATEPEPVKLPEPSPSVGKAPEKNTGTTTASLQPSNPTTTKTDSSDNESTGSAFVTFQRNMIIVLAGISIIILALIGFLMMQRKNNTPKSRPVEPVQELKTTADVMATIDARIKEKFKQYEEADRD